MKFAILVGIPHAGKSLFAKHIHDTEGHTIIDLNKLRKAITGTTLDYVQSDPIDAYTRQSAIIMAKHYLSLNHSIIIDDENLTMESRRSWYAISKEFKTPLQIYWINTTPSIALRVNELYGGFPSRVLDARIDTLEYPTYRESKQIRWINVTRFNLTQDELTWSGKLAKL